LVYYLRVTSVTWSKILKEAQSGLILDIWPASVPSILRHAGSFQNSIEKLDNRLLLLAGQAFDLVESNLKLRRRAGLCASALGMTSDKLGKRNVEGLGGALHEVQRWIDRAALVVVDHFARSIERLG